MSPSQEIASRPIWTASLDALMQRWMAKPGHDEVVAPDDFAQAAERLRRRAEAVRRYLELPAPRELDTPRRWEAGWDVHAAWNRLRTAIEAMGWEVKVATASRLSSTTLAASQSKVEAESTLIIDEEIAEAEARAYRDGGLLLPFTWREGAVLILADELYSAAVERMGNPPAREWVDRLSRYVFVKDVLGWPFYPLVLEVLS